MQKHYIIGTAGHIDHGKTTLAKALTGKDTDRLKEEKERNISIELGFAPFTLPNSHQVSLIDVPGHEKFIRQMVAGVGGIDLVLLVIAADEGVMPQTKEHLQIIELLGIKNGIIVLTKKDLVEPDFLELVEEDIKDILTSTSLENAPIVSVSSVTSEGIALLKERIQEKLLTEPERSSSGFFRMPIDRVFSLKGIGTIVTGTVYSGMLQVGQELAIMPSGHLVRIRSLQIHSDSVTEAFAGQRVAINVAGIDIDQLNRGDSLVTPKQWEPSNRIDIELRTAKELESVIKHNSEIKLLIGTTEIIGNLFFYDRKEAKDDEIIYAQIKLKEKIISSRKERFIIRRPSPSITIGGGKIIDPNAKKHKYKKETINQIKLKAKDSLNDLILQLLFDKEQTIFLTQKEISNSLNIPENELESELNNQIQLNQVVKLDDGKIAIYSAKLRHKDLTENILSHLKEYHQSFPLRLGQPKAEFISHFFEGLKPRISQIIIGDFIKNSLIKATEEYISIYSFSPHLPNKLQDKVAQLEHRLMKQRFTPEPWLDLTKELAISEMERQELYNYLLNMKKIIKLTDKILIHQECFDELKQIVTKFLLANEQITLQEAKELLDVSRKYLVPLMELLDNEKVTVLRQGHNYRVLRKT